MDLLLCLHEDTGRRADHGPLLPAVFACVCVRMCHALSVQGGAGVQGLQPAFTKVILKCHQGIVPTRGSGDGLQ